MFDNGENIIIAGLKMIVWEFILGLIYIFTSEPFVNLFQGFMNVDTQDVASTASTCQTIYFMIFAIAWSIPVLRFILFIMRDETQTRFYRY